MPFLCLAGIDDATNKRSSVVCQVFVDEELIYYTPLLRRGEVWHIQAPIAPRAKTLRLARIIHAWL